MHDCWSSILWNLYRILLSNSSAHINRCELDFSFSQSLHKTETMLQYLKKIRKLKQHLIEKWLAKTPKQKWQFTYYCANQVCLITGVQVLSDMKNYWYTTSCGVMASIYFLTSIYTIQYYVFVKREDYFRAVECTCLIGHAITVRLILFVLSYKITVFFLLQHIFFFSQGPRDVLEKRWPPTL